jgi:hypothetical protein
MKIYVDIDGTICESINSDYPNSKPIQENIDKINKLFNEGNTIVYYTARGMSSGKDWTELTNKQLREWGCLFHEIITNHKPNYDLMICDKTKRIEEV